MILAGGESIARPIIMSLSTVCSTATVVLKERLKERQAIVGIRPSTLLVLPVLACQIALKSNSQVNGILTSTPLPALTAELKNNSCSNILWRC